LIICSQKLKLLRIKDGQWNWIFQIHQDINPNDSFTAPNQENKNLEPLGDLIEGESRWVDILKKRNCI
jgi:hypothetical protein